MSRRRAFSNDIGVKNCYKKKLVLYIMNMNIRMQKINADSSFPQKLSPICMLNLGTENHLHFKFSLEPRRRFVNIDGFVRVPASPISLNNNRNTFRENFHYPRCTLILLGNHLH